MGIHSPAESTGCRDVRPYDAFGAGGRAEIKQSKNSSGLGCTVVRLYGCARTELELELAGVLQKCGEKPEWMRKVRLTTRNDNESNTPTYSNEEVNGADSILTMGRTRNGN